MATKDKYYLNEAGLELLRDWILLQLLPLTKDLDLLQKTDGTPGSIQYLIDNAINAIDISDLQQEEPIRIYGGSASEVLEEAK